MSRLGTLGKDLMLAVLQNLDDPWSVVASGELRPLLSEDYQVALLDFILANAKWMTDRVYDLDINRLFDNPDGLTVMKMSIQLRQLPNLYVRLQPYIQRLRYVKIHIRTPLPKKHNLDLAEISRIIRRLEAEPGITPRISVESENIWKTFIWLYGLDHLVNVIQLHAFRGSTFPPNLSGCINLRVIDDFAFLGLEYAPVDLLANCVNLRVIGRGAFDALKTVLDLSNCTQLEVIQDLAFTKAELGTLKPAASLLFIGDSAFSNLSINEVDLSQCVNLRAIGKAAFSSLLRAPAMPVDGKLDTIEEAAFESLREGLDLSKCTNLTYIGNSAFRSVTTPPLFPPSIEHIGDFSFEELFDPPDLSQCSKLRYIGEHAFTNVHSPPPMNFENLSYIGARAFTGLTREPLHLVNCPQLRFISNGAFDNLLETPRVQGCPLLENIGEEAFRFIPSVPDLSDCSNLRYIGALAFFSATQMDRMFNCESLRYIGDSAFYSLQTPFVYDHCRNLDNIYIGINAFYTLEQNRDENAQEGGDTGCTLM